MARWLDRILIVMFSICCFVSLFYTPQFLLGCGWEGLAQGPEGTCSETWVGRAWLGYVQTEPLYANAPLWLQLVNEFDTYFFGWFYLLSLIVFIRKRQDDPRYRALATFMSGMMAYAMTFYFTWELMTYQETGADIVAVLSFNGLWLALFLLLLLRLYVFKPRPDASVHSTAGVVARRSA
jgi:hypothetical protein